MGQKKWKIGFIEENEISKKIIGTAIEKSRHLNLKKFKKESISMDNTAIYSELCSSYRAIDDFRSKLLGFLPLTSGTGIFLLLNNDKTLQYALPVGIFGILITIGLFCYEYYGIIKCTVLIYTGKQLELRNGNILVGQFSTRPEQFFNEPFAAALIYSAVLSAWVYLTIINSNCKCIHYILPLGVFINIFLFSIFLFKVTVKDIINVTNKKMQSRAAAEGI